MIVSLRGTLVSSQPCRAVIEVHGVGYEVFLPLSSCDRLPPPGGDVFLLTHLVVREDSHTLYGFATADERDLFRLLIDTVNGIGPRLALNLLSGMSPFGLRTAVASGDTRALARIPGVGKKTAERIVLELRDKLGTASAGPSAGAGAPPASPADQALDDAIRVLVQLGIRQPDAQEAVRAARAMLGPDASTESLVRASLRKAGS